jgi:metal iron transporter
LVYVSGNVCEVVEEYVQMQNHWITAVLAALIWGVIVVLNVALLVLIGKGDA